MNRRKVSDVLFYALQCAKSDRESIIDAYRGDKKEKVVRDALADIKAFVALQDKLFGTHKTVLEGEMEKMKSFNVLDLKKLMKNSPNLFNHAEDCMCEHCKSEDV